MHSNLEHPSQQTTSPRSGFVTAVAWVFIVLAGFATLIAVLQNVMISLVFPVDEIPAAMRQAEAGEPMPWFARFMMENLRLLFAMFLVVSALTLVSAVGLLRRRNWARILFIAIMGLGIAWNLAGLAMPFLMFSNFASTPGGAPAEFRDQMQIMMYIMTGVSVAFEVAFTVLFGWIIKRLVSTEVRREFSGA